MELEAIRLKSGWFVIPLGQVGMMGWHPVPWEMTYIKRARSASDAVAMAKRPGAVRWYKEEV
jgi:hypothetical protein